MSVEPMHNASLLELTLADLEIATRLLELIEFEQEALLHRRFDILGIILDEKQPLLVELDQHNHLRSALLQRVGLPLNREGLLAYADRFEQDNQLVEAADRLSEYIERCKEANNRNGQIIKANQHTVSNMLEILQGPPVPSLYNRRGCLPRQAYQRPRSQA
ncbi:flagella synthesis protein FlgN [Pseudomonas duriflava]|uniref:Flagella synthesis protein FlgN n=1 Tax=Pseudomonas duriflava TaxID=459528 RepID=A0A562Q9X4_9PSED|nr:flagellar protein FlgN [Pseudomonas duriflava]TWI53557.1 flagella synthesis protein FlgN [Pseudomonas duriflava]